MPDTTSFKEVEPKPNRQQLVFQYKNYRGEYSIRTVIPFGIEFKATEFHPKVQWIMRAFDLDKLEVRDFALTDIVEFFK